jgi:hypothetical protein
MLEVERIVGLGWSDDRTVTGETRRSPYITSVITALVSTRQSADDADEWEDTDGARGLLVYRGVEVVTGWVTVIR